MGKMHFGKLQFDKEKCKYNLKHNFIFLISAWAFFATFIRFRVSSLLGVMLACLFAIIIAAKCPPLTTFIKEQPLWMKVFALLSTIGMILSANNELLVQFDTSIAANGSAKTAVDMIGCGVTTMRQIVKIAGNCAQFGSCIALFVAFVAFWYFMKKTIKDLNCFKNITKIEFLVAGIFFCIEIIAVIVVYTQGINVYGASVYSSDGLLLYEPSAFISILHAENDLRQPLFGAFAAPFAAPLYLIRVVCKNVSWIMPVLLIVIQFALVVSASFLIADAVCEKTIERTMLMALLLSTYATLYNGFLIEQYMIAYWYLALLIYAITKKKGNSILLASAIGTLSTGVCMIPFMPKHTLRDHFKEWVIDIIRYCISFACIMLSLGRGDVIFSVFSKTSSLLGRFGSGSVSFMERLYQYFNFVKTCIIAPNNAMAISERWELMSVDSLSVVGVIIFAVAIVSFIINRKQIISQVAFAWILLSFILCVVIGWGSTENIMPLYALYFFWAFVVLVFQAIKNIFEYIKYKPLKYVLYSIIIVVLYVSNMLIMRPFVEYLKNFTGGV